MAIDELAYSLAANHKGQWSDEKTLKLRHEGMQKGKKFVEDLTATYNGAKEFRIFSVVSFDGLEFSKFDAIMKKSGGKSISTSR